MKFILSLILLAFVVPVSAAGISGNVYGVEYCEGICGGTPYPLAGVLITAGNQSNISDFGGAYSLNLSAGTYNVTFSKLPEYTSVVFENVTVTANNTTEQDAELMLKQTGSITGTVTAPCIPSVDGECYSGYEAPYNLMTIPYYSGELVDVVIGEYDDVIMFEYHDSKDFVEVPANSVHTFRKGRTTTPLRIYSNSSLAAVHKRFDYHIVINPIQILSQNLHADVLALNTASLNILQNLGYNASVENFGYGGRFNV